MRIHALAAPAVLGLIWNCGTSTDPDATPPHDTTGIDGSTKTDGGLVGDDDGAIGDALAPDALSTVCVPNAACSTNAGAPCRTGLVQCGAFGASCADGPAAQDGTMCNAGLCSGGTCRAPTTVDKDINLSTNPSSAGRTCAEAPQFSVSMISPSSVTLTEAPTGDCLAAGDEALLINLQGSSAGTVNVGNWELVRLASISGTTVTFLNAKTRNYGATAGSDTGIGIGATDQKVALIRVPQFGALTINSGKVLTARRWNGKVGGVVTLRAAKLTVEGQISASGLGYRDGRWSSDNDDCADNVLTEAGESFTGPALAQLANNGGGAGGLSAVTGVSFNGSTPMNAGSSHATQGEAGKNPNSRTIGDAGATYGINDATKLTLGSGASGNLTCSVGFAGPALLEVDEKLAGGIVLLIADRIDVGASGSITATAAESFRDIAASGGYVYLKGTTFNLGSDLVTAKGGISTPTNPPASPPHVKAGDGYIVLDGKTVTGTTDPAAHLL
jgi:hypothetical protein